MALTLHYTHGNTNVTSPSAYVRIVDVNGLRKESRKKLANGPAPEPELGADGNYIPSAWTPEYSDEKVWTCDIRAGVYDTRAARDTGKDPVSHIYLSCNVAPELNILDQCYGKLKTLDILSGAVDC